MFQIIFFIKQGLKKYENNDYYAIIRAVGSVFIFKYEESPETVDPDSRTQKCGSGFKNPKNADPDFESTEKNGSETHWLLKYFLREETHEYRTTE